MLAKTHRAAGVTSATAALLLVSNSPSFFPPGELTSSLIKVAITIVAAYFASTLPDIDQYIPFITHRGITHAIWIPLGILYLGQQYAGQPYISMAIWGLFIGYFSHIIGDAFSNAGVAFLYPFQRYEHTSSGAFYVKGNRGLALPLYEVGKSTLINPVIVFNIISVVFTILLIKNIY